MASPGLYYYFDAASSRTTLAAAATYQKPPKPIGALRQCNSGNRNLMRTQPSRARIAGPIGGSNSHLNRFIPTTEFLPISTSAPARRISRTFHMRTMTISSIALMLAAGSAFGAERALRHGISPGQTGDGRTRFGSEPRRARHTGQAGAGCRRIHPRIALRGGPGAIARADLRRRHRAAHQGSGTKLFGHRGSRRLAGDPGGRQIRHRRSGPE